LKEAIVLAKKTVKNQIFAGVEYFDVSTDGESITLRPLQKSRVDDVRARLAQMGIDEQDVTDAVSWSRKSA
jgi:hypothetical protein